MKHNDIVRYKLECMLDGTSNEYGGLRKTRSAPAPMPPI